MNTYQTGKLGIGEGVALVFGLVVTRLFLSGLTDVVRVNGQILWLSMIIYTVIPLLILYMMIYVNNSASGDIVAVCEHLVGKPGAWLMITAYILMFFANSASLLRQYAEYTIITALPRAEFQLVILWYVVSVGIVCYLGIEAICRAGYIMLPFVIVAMIVIFALVSPFYIAYNLTPWQGNGIIKAVQSGITGVGFNLGVLSLIFMSSAFQNVKTIKRIAMYAFGGSLLLRIVYMFVYIMVFGVNVGGEKAMPFFELTRLVYLNQYFQRIEALFIMVWVIVGLLSIVGSLYIGLYLIVILLKLPALRPIVPLGVVIIANLAMLPPNIGYTIDIDRLLLQISLLGMYVFPGILFIMALLKKRRKKTCADL